MFCKKIERTFAKQKLCHVWAGFKNSIRVVTQRGKQKHPPTGAKGEKEVLKWGDTTGAKGLSAKDATRLVRHKKICTMKRIAGLRACVEATVNGAHEDEKREKPTIGSRGTTFSSLPRL